MPNIIKCFTDASYSQHKSLSIIGYKIGEHDVVLEELLNVKNTQAELYAIKKCIKVCNEIYPDDEIIIYTDCQRAFKDPNYSPNITLQKIKGHKKGSLKTEDDKVFSIVDKAVRKKLRQIKSGTQIA